MHTNPIQEKENEYILFCRVYPILTRASWGFFFQLCSYLIMKVSIHLCGRNRGNSVLRWHLSVMKTKMRERHHLGLVLNLFLHTWCFPPSYFHP